MSRLEIALLDLEKAIAYTAGVMRSQRMTPREAAIYHNWLAFTGRSAQAWRRREAERERHERLRRGNEV